VTATVAEAGGRDQPANHPAFPELTCPQDSKVLPDWAKADCGNFGSLLQALECGSGCKAWDMMFRSEGNERRLEKARRGLEGSRCNSTYVA